MVYHEFPLQAHRYSREAALYAEAASQLGHQQLLKVYDSLFMDQAQWGEDGKVEASIAKALPRADFEKLKKIMKDPGINATVDKEIQLGTQNQIESTPTFFIYSGQKQLQKVVGAFKLYISEDVSEYDYKMTTTLRIIHWLCRFFLRESSFIADM